MKREDEAGLKLYEHTKGLQQYEKTATALYNI